MRRETHDDVIKWKHFRVTGPLCGEFIGLSEFPTQRPVARTLMFSLICVWINGWVNNREAGDLRRHWGRCDVIVMIQGWGFGVTYIRGLTVCWQSCNVIQSGKSYWVYQLLTLHNYLEAKYKLLPVNKLGTCTHMPFLCSCQKPLKYQNGKRAWQVSWMIKFGVAFVCIMCVNIC